ncbi:MAG: response regulator transcription factor [Flavobacteriales bacterium]|nr:response regulator transcription factor [Flavobacteriales bacterium]
MNAMPEQRMADPQWRVAVVDALPLFGEALALAVGAWPQGRLAVQATDADAYMRACAENGHIHLALVDLHLPGRDGLELLRWMARHQPRTRALLIAHAPTPLQVRQALQAGARGVLHRAVSREGVLLALDHLCTVGFHYNELVSHALRRQVREEGERQQPHRVWDSLTPREREFLRCYAAPGMERLAEVARRMGISRHTSESFRKHVVRKTGIRHRAELVRWVLENGLGA